MYPTYSACARLVEGGRAGAAEGARCGPAGGARHVAATFSNLRCLFAAALKLAGLAELIDWGGKRTTAWAPLVEAIAGDKRLSPAWPPS